MKQKEILALSDEALQSKEKGTKTLIYIFIPIIVGLFYATISEYLKEGEMDYSLLTIAICSVGGLASLYPEWKIIREEIAKRGI